MDIQKIYQAAKDVILEDGEFLPTLFVEFEGITETIIAPLIGFGTHEQDLVDKQKMLFSAGRALGKEYLSMKVRVVAFACEAWIGKTPLGVPYPYDRPRNDPDREEALIVSVLDVSSPPKLKHSVYKAEMIRDGSGELVDLLADSKPMEVGFNKLLTAFLAGTLSADMTEAELARMMRGGKV